VDSRRNAKDTVTGNIPEVIPELPEDAVNYSAVYGIESWDGYLVAFARILGVKEIHSINEKLSKG